MSGTPLADWKADISFVSWARADYGLTLGKVGRIINRVYGGYVFSRFK